MINKKYIKTNRKEERKREKKMIDLISYRLPLYWR